ncbi:MAG: PH domain-containing protein [Phycisphaerales bacterium]|nr:PH domain-containing protein [Phycisphaerales bacterium]
MTEVDQPHTPDSSSDTGEPGDSPTATAGTHVAPTDRAAAAGLPPDAGPEQRVRMIRPAFLRGRPHEVVAWIGSPLALAGLAMFMGGDHGGAWATKALLILGPIALVGLVVRWLLVTFGCSLEISNKRTVERHGVFSRTVNEVLHDHIRNVQVRQSFYERLVNVGRIGIASAGADGIEIQVAHLPDPHGVRKVIDLYRPL